ncbi:MAG: RagB/SusD family nutrient uptake outer membrane protein [Chitinophagaceae bacterium]
MNTIKKLRSLYFLGVVFMFSACHKVLNQEPKNSTYDDVYWQSASDCNSALAGAYSLLRASLTYKNDCYYMYGDAVPASYFTIQYTGDALEYIQSGNFSFNYNVTSLGNWSRFYKTVAMCNTIIYKVPSISDDLLAADVDDPQTFRNKVVGQALFIRAYTYFMLTRVWGDVPIETNYYENPIDAPQLPRSAKTLVMQQIEDDCHEAIGLLKWGYDETSEQAVTANKGSAYALLAHLYLWRATMSDVSTDVPIAADVQNADTTIDVILNSGQYSFVDTASYKKMFVGKSTESLFELSMSEDDKEGSYSGIGLYFLPTQYLATAGSNPRFYVVKSYLTNHFGFGGNWVFNYDAWQWEWVADYDSTDVRFRDIFTNVSQSHPVCLKYSNVIYRSANSTDPYLSNNMILFRLSDIQLLKAETSIYKGDLATAITIINDMRDRRGSNSDNRVDASSSESDVLYEYILERGKEMYLEGHIFWDLLRTRQYGDYITWLGESRFRNEGFYWPVDPTLFNDNINLTQTSYWKGKL